MSASFRGLFRHHLSLSLFSLGVQVFQTRLGFVITCPSLQGLAHLSTRSFTKKIFLPLYSSCSSYRLSSSSSTITSIITCHFFVCTLIISYTQPDKPDSFPPYCSSKPQPGRTIISNPLRPTIAIADQMFCWDTPFSIRYCQHLKTILPLPLVDSAFMAI